jgi:hypothetical protein
VLEPYLAISSTENFSSKLSLYKSVSKISGDDVFLESDLRNRVHCHGIDRIAGLFVEAFHNDTDQRR